jgi:hypothetical protein
MDYLFLSLVIHRCDSQHHMKSETLAHREPLGQKATASAKSEGLQKATVSGQA